MKLEPIKIYIITSLLVLVSLIGIFFIIKRRGGKPNSLSGEKIELPTPIYNEAHNREVIRKITPRNTYPTFTGVKEETLPPEEQSLVNQKQVLKKRVPLSQDLFSISFDYGEDKFIVKLKEPKDKAKNSFDDWLKKRYSSIPTSRFIFR